MSVCPHPRAPHERVLGPVTQLICPDCGEVFGTAGVDYGPEDSTELEDVAEPEPEICNYATDGFYCVLPIDHIGPHGGYEDEEG